MPKAIKAHVITSGQHHDFDFIRLQILQALARYDTVRTTCSSDYAPVAELAAADVLITYTNNIVPNATQLPVIKDFLARGGRWLAMHGTAAIVRFSDGPVQDLKIVELPGLVETPDLAPEFMALIGGRFLAHLPYGEITVNPVKPEDPLLRGIGSFTILDEPYLVELTAEVEILLDAHYAGKTEGYARDEWYDDQPRPLMWRRRHGPGEIVYLALGHRTGRYDLLDLIDEMPITMAGPWEHPVFRALFDRCIDWGVNAGAARVAVPAG